MYCCCGEKKTRENPKCLCDWEDWHKGGHPCKDGVYLTRAIDSFCGDSYEEKRRYSLKPLFFDIDLGGAGKKPIHWEGCSLEGNMVYAWKEISD